MLVNSKPLPPGDSGLPFVGEALRFFRDPDFAKKKHQQYGDIFKTHLFGKPTVFVKGVAANRFVLSNENRHFEITWPPSTRILLGDLSLARQTGELHQNRRKLLSQAFMPRALAGYTETIATLTHQYLDRWLAQAELTWYPELRHYTFDVACKLLAGLDRGSETKLGQLFEIWSEGLFSLPVNLPWTRFGRAKRSRTRLAQQLEIIIRQRQQWQLEHTSARNTAPDALGLDALGLLIQAKDDQGEPLSTAELRDQILLLLFAGHETLTSAIASFCLLVAQHPAVMAKLRQEQQQWSGQPLTLETLKQMTYLEQVLRETMRLIAPVGGGFREVIAPCEIEGYQVPQNWMVLYEINSTQQDDQLYPQPDQFNPDRFSPEQLQQQTVDRQKYGYLPFGGGVRECLGKEFARLEMKIFAALLLQRCDWNLLPHQDLTLVTIPTPHPKDGLKVRLTSVKSG